MIGKYYLLPFTFTRIHGFELIVNEIGDFIVAPKGTVEKLSNKETINDVLYKSLVANFFISESRIPDLIDVYAERLAEKKRFLDSFTSLHIFVLTLRCNQNCIYCQASSKKDWEKDFSMTRETMEKSVDLMYRSPSKHITMEFQGGEPTLEYDILKFGIELSERRKLETGKQVRYVLCTNSVNLSDELLALCLKYKVLISTSIDGPEFLHNQNRGKIDSYKKVVSGVEKARRILGFDHVSALMTTSEKSLQYPIEIIDEYRKLGFHSIFLRPLNPYGLAKDNKDWNLYVENFISFYKKALAYIIKINLDGNFFVENYTAIILKKILTPYTTGFVDLQSPAGIINSVLVYNYDGFVYASDESRMLAEYKDYTFQLGKVSDKYEDIVYGEKVKKLSELWSNECITGCSDCAFKVYCGADPVRNYSTQNDMYGYRPTSLFCKKNKEIISYLFTIIIENDKDIMRVFRSWIK